MGSERFVVEDGVGGELVIDSRTGGRALVFHPLPTYRRPDNQELVRAVAAALNALDAEWAAKLVEAECRGTLRGSSFPGGGVASIAELRASQAAPCVGAVETDSAAEVNEAAVAGWVDGCNAGLAVEPDPARYISVADAALLIGRLFGVK